MLDVTIIGGGIIGANVAYRLGLRNANVLLLEKDTDVANGTTKANSAIVHAGYDPEPGTAMARLNVRGSRLTKELAQNLSVPYKQIGSLVLAFDGADMMMLDELFHRGYANGLHDLRLLNPTEIKEIEPNLSPDVKAALLAPSAAVIEPWEMATALADTAVLNGVQVKLNTEVTAVNPIEGGWRVVTADGTAYDTKYVINAAGTYADVINDMAAPHCFTTKPSKGEYYLLDKNQSGLVNHVIFQCPNEKGKGVLVSPTVHGNIIVGPDAVLATDRDRVDTQADGLAFVRTAALKSVPTLNWRSSIRNFAGVRANSDKDDFIIEQTAPGFITLGGIKSPGLSAAPAIAEEAEKLLEQAGFNAEKKENPITTRKKVRFSALSPQEKAKLIQEKPAYGRIICRCEGITEGEIVEALHSPIPPTTIDAIKRRCRAGMGRCQGGFCAPRVHELICRELGVAPKEVLKDKAGSVIITDETKGRK
ncbi:MAG: NAD(P)/FAD-dependent oxidoreductase [Oscillospiraceae bacterium]|nr:NAD(P)/FAD-dependent oxidoreductase [Oscillospiraceae bacterium]